MPWKGQSEFNSIDLKPWKSTKDGKEIVAGAWKEVNIKMVEGDEKKTRFALVTIDGSGHMVCSWTLWECLTETNCVLNRYPKINLKWLWIC